MKRYKPSYWEWFGELKLNEGMREHPQEEYVKYSDVPQWVSVEDIVPEDGERILAWIDYGERQEMEIYTWDRFWRMNGIIKWQPLPNPPEDTDDET